MSNDKASIAKQIQLTFEEIGEAGKVSDTLKLLKCANKLSSLRYNLGDLYIEAKEFYDSSNAEYKSQLDEGLVKYRKAGKSIEEAKAQARMDNHDRLVALIGKDRERTHLYTIREDLAIKISNIQSYASDLRSMRVTREL